jgi:hypothetical protein
MAISHLPDTKGNQSYALSALMRDVQKAQKWRVNKKKTTVHRQKKEQKSETFHTLPAYLYHNAQLTKLSCLLSLTDWRWSKSKTSTTVKRWSKADPTGSIQTINLPITTYCL